MQTPVKCCRDGKMIKQFTMICEEIFSVDGKKRISSNQKIVTINA